MIVAKSGSRLSCADAVRLLRRTDLTWVQGLRQTRGAGQRCPDRGRLRQVRSTRWRHAPSLRAQRSNPGPRHAEWVSPPSTA